jgi:hypothetical protein
MSVCQHPSFVMCSQILLTCPEASCDQRTLQALQALEQFASLRVPPIPFCLIAEMCGSFAQPQTRQQWLQAGAKAGDVNCALQLARYAPFLNSVPLHFVPTHFCLVCSDCLDSYRTPSLALPQSVRIFPSPQQSSAEAAPPATPQPTEVSAPTASDEQLSLARSAPLPFSHHSACHKLLLRCCSPTVTVAEESEWPFVLLRMSSGAYHFPVRVLRFERTRWDWDPPLQSRIVQAVSECRTLQTVEFGQILSWEWALRLVQAAVNNASVCSLKFTLIGSEILQALPELLQRRSRGIPMHLQLLRDRFFDQTRHRLLVACAQASPLLRPRPLL